MPDLIDREELLEQLQISKECLDDGTMLTIQNIVECLPPADTEPHAHWETIIYGRNQNLRPKCSICGYVLIFTNKGTNYCPVCGCKMDEVINDG